MGWCSATEIFDAVAEALIGEREGFSRVQAAKIEKALKALIEALENHDWDCQQESAYWDHPLVQAVFREMHSDWFESEG